MREYTIGRLNGRFVVTWYETDGRRRRYRLAACTRKEAEAEARDVIVRELKSPKELTVTELWEGYRKAQEGRSIAESMGFTGKSILPFFGAIRPEQITDGDAKTYADERRAAGIQDGTIWTQLNHLRITLSWAVKTGRIAKAPYIPRPQKPAPRDRYLNRAEIARLLEAATTPHIRLAIILMLTTGARVGAVLDLTWDRVDFERGIIDLRSKADGPRKGRATPPINQTLRVALMEGREAAISDYVVEWAGDRVGSIKKGFASVAKKADLDGVSPHVLRHTAAVHMAEAGHSMAEIAQMLGHSDSRTTEQIYARFSPQHLRHAASALEFSDNAQVR